MRYKYPGAITKNWVRPCFQLCMSIKDTINRWRKFAPKPSAFIKNLFLRSAQYSAKNWSICGASMFLDVWQKLVQFSKTGYHWYQRFFFSRASVCFGATKRIGRKGKSAGNWGENAFPFFYLSTSPPLFAPTIKARKNCWANQVTQPPTPLNGLLLSCSLQVS